MQSNRKLGLDIIRCFAIIFVFSIHFFLYTNFYHTSMTSTRMLIFLFFRWLFFTCVPLFLILTGYLQNQKRISKEFYKKAVFRVLFSYYFISIIIYLFNKFYLHDSTSFLRGLCNIIGFNNSDYSWYVEMYIGLAILIPFLNILYNSISKKNNKILLILSLIILTAIPSLLSYLPNNIKLFPNYWTIIYPITYYFVGCYISEYRPKIPKKYCIASILILLNLQTILSFLYSYNSVFDWKFLGGYGSIFTILTSILIFVLFYDINIKPKFIRAPIYIISLFSFDMYLFSYITDKYIYDKLDLNISNDFYWYPVIILLTILSTLVMSAIKKFIMFLFKKISHTIGIYKLKKIFIVLGEEIKKMLKGRHKLLKTILIISISLNIIFINFLVIKFIHRTNDQCIQEKITVVNLDENIVFVGDSITFLYKLHKYFPGHNTINSGIDGAKSENFLDNMNDKIYKYNPSKVFILIGTNQLQYDSIEKITNDIFSLVDSIKNNRKYTKIYVQSIYPINKTFDNNFTKVRNNKKIMDINKILKKNQITKGYIYINVYDTLLDETGNLIPEYTKDGLHLNSKGYDHVSKVLRKYINE